MGSQTPIFSLRYPFQGETVDPTHFKNLADDIDAALDLIDARSLLVLNKPALKIAQNTDQTGITSGSTTIITWDTATYNPNGWWNAGAPTLVALPAGIYLVSVAMSNLVGTTTGIDDQMLEIQINSVVQTRKTANVAPTAGSAPFSHHSIIYTATPQNLRISWAWWGSVAGGATNQATDLSIRLLRDL